MAQRAAVTSAPAAGPISDETQTTVNTEPASIHFYVGDSDTIMFVVMNYKLGTISEPYDTGIVYDFGSSYIWSSSNNIHDGGFMPIIFDAPNSRTHAFFVTANGVVVDHIFTGGGYQNAQLDQHLTFFIDYDPDGSPTYGTLKMFDGVNVTTLTLDGVTNMSWGYGTGSVTSDRTVLFEYNSEFHLIGMDGQNTLIHTSVPEARGVFNINWTHSYVCGLFYDETDNNMYKSFKVWASDGTLLQNIDISGYGTDVIGSDDLYGNQDRFLALLYNGTDTGIDYLVLFYDGVANTVLLDTHEKGSDYEFFGVYTTDLEKWNPSNAMKSNGVIIFYKDGTHPAVSGFNSALYFDVWCMHHDLQAFTKTSLVTGDEIGWRISTNQEEGAIYNGDPMFLYYDVTGETFGPVTAAAFTSAGFVDFPVGFDPTDIDSITSTECIAPDHVFFSVSLLSTPGVRTWKIMNSSGSTLLTHTTSLSTADGGGPMYNALVVLDFDDYSNCFSFSPARGKEVLPDPSPNTYGLMAYNDIENEFGTSSGYSTRNAILQTFNPDNNLIGFQIYNNESGLQSYVELPAYVILHRFLMGESVVFLSYNDLETSYFSGAIYDIQTGELLNISVVPLNEYPSNSANYGDRIWDTLFLDDDNVIYFYSRSGMVSFNLGSNLLGSAYNDAFWIND